MKENNNVNVSFPIGNIVFVVFLVLKLTHVVDWSWWWVTAPVWVPLGIATIGCLLILIAKLIDRSQY